MLIKIKTLVPTLSNGELGNGNDNHQHAKQLRDAVMNKLLFILVALICPALAHAQNTGMYIVPIQQTGGINATSLQGVPLNTNLPGVNQCLVYDGTEWSPSSNCGGGGGGGSIFTSFTLGGNTPITGVGNFLQITATAPITFGTMTGTGTSGSPFVAPLSLANSGATPGTYSCINGTVTAQGLFTAVTNGSCCGGGGGIWSGITGNGTNTSTGFVLAPSVTSTIAWVTTCPSGMSVDCEDITVNGNGVRLNSSRLWNKLGTGGIDATALSGFVPLGSIPTIPPANGGTGLVNPTAHDLVIAEGSSSYNLLSMPTGQLLIGQGTSADPTTIASVGGGSNPVFGTISTLLSGQFLCADSTPKIVNCTPGIPVVANSSGFTVSNSNRATLGTLKSATNTTITLLAPANYPNNYFADFINIAAGTAQFQSSGGVFINCSGSTSQTTQNVPFGYWAVLYNDGTNFCIPTIPTLAALVNAPAGSAMTINTTTGAFGSTSISASSCGYGAASGTIIFGNGSGNCPTTNAAFNVFVSATAPGILIGSSTSTSPALEFTNSSADYNIDLSGSTLQIGANASLTNAGALTVTSCAGCSVFPLTVSGTVNSGGIPYFCSTTQECSSAGLGLDGVVLGDGAGAAPFTSAGLSFSSIAGTPTLLIGQVGAYSGQLALYSVGGGTLTMGVNPNNPVSSYTLAYPDAIGTTGQVLNISSIFGSGALLGWTSGTGVTSITGDGNMTSNSGSTGAVTIQLASGAKHTVWSNSSGSAGPGNYTANPTSSTYTLYGPTSGSCQLSVTATLGTLQLCGAGNVDIDSSGDVQVSGALMAIGTQTVSGCSLTGAVGGASAGSFARGTSGTCTVTITPGITATHGYTCDSHDITTTADTIKQTAYSTTTATISGTTVSGDTVTWSCIAF